MVRSFVALQRIDPGFDPNGVLTFFAAELQAPDEPARAAPSSAQMRERLRALPGVTAVTAANPLPLDGDARQRALGHRGGGRRSRASSSRRTCTSCCPATSRRCGRRCSTGARSPTRTTAERDEPRRHRRMLARRRSPDESAVGQAAARAHCARRGGVVRDHRRRGASAARHARERRAREIFFTDGFLGHGAASGGRCGRRAIRSGSRRRCARGARIDPRMPVSRDAADDRVRRRARRRRRGSRWC